MVDAGSHLGLLIGDLSQGSKVSQDGEDKRL